MMTDRFCTVIISESLFDTCIHVSAKNSLFFPLFWATLKRIKIKIILIVDKSVRVNYDGQTAHKIGEGHGKTGEDIALVPKVIFSSPANIPFVSHINHKQGKRKNAEEKHG